MATNTSIEMKVFRNNYANFCNILKRETTLLPYLVEKEIISKDEEDEIRSKPSAEKGSTLLGHISGPLEAGHTHGFRELLEIMRKYGKLDTKNFARKISRECQPNSKLYDYLSNFIPYYLNKSPGVYFLPSTRGWHSHMLCILICILGQEKSQTQII